MLSDMFTVDPIFPISKKEALAFRDLMVLQGGASRTAVATGMAEGGARLLGYMIMGDWTKMQPCYI